jgi:hypothetical protein
MAVMVKLQVYFEHDCWTCDETQRIVAELSPQFPRVAIELIDAARSGLPENVFAVPTYVLDGRVISLGNPYPDELRRQLWTALRGHPT